MNMAVAQLITGRRDYHGVVRYLWLLAWAALAWAQTQPKEKAEDYETSGRSGAVAVGAEYMVHSFSADGKTFLAPEYLVVEVALYPPKDVDIQATQSEFSLRVDGKRLPSAATQQVLRSLERSGWNRERGVTGSVGAGNTDVVLGAPRRPTGEYPQPPGAQYPRAPRAPEPDYRANVPRDDMKATDVLTRTAFPEGRYRGAVSGYLYFYYKGNASKIRSVELIYQDMVLKLK